MWGQGTELRSPCVHLLAVMKCQTGLNWTNLSSQKIVWMKEKEFEANELRGSKNSAGAGHGELTCCGITLRQLCG